MGTQELIITLKKDETFQSEKFRTALKEVDYTIRNIRIKASGEVLIRSEKKSNRLTGLALKVLDQVFPILSDIGETKDLKEQQVKRAKLIAELWEAIEASKQNLTIVGRVLEIEGTGEGILLEQILGF